MLSLNQPGGLWALLSLIPVAMLYFLRMRFRTRPTSSLFLWKNLAGKIDGGRKPAPRSWFLFALQVLVGVLAALALSKPLWERAKSQAPGVVYILDDSASMSCLQGGSSRLSQAKEALRTEALADMAKGNRLALMAASRPEAGSLCRNRTELGTRLALLSQSYSSLDEAQLALGLRAWLLKRGGSWVIRLYSDGGLASGGEILRASFPGGLDIRAAAGPVIDLGISGPRLESGPRGDLLSLSLHNSGPTTQSRSLILSSSGQELLNRTISLSPGVSETRLELGQRLLDGSYRLAILDAGDPYPIDDECFLAIQAPKPTRVLYVGEENPFILACLKRRDIYLSKAKSVEPGTAGQYDLLVLNRVAGAPAPSLDCLAFGCLPGGSPARLLGRAQGQLVAQDGLALTRYVAFRDGQSQSLLFEPGPQAQAPVRMGRSAVGISSEAGGRKLLALGFSPESGDGAELSIGLDPAFPILVQNALEWLAPPVEPQDYLSFKAGIEARRDLGPGFSSPAAALVEKSGRYTLLRFERPGIYPFTTDLGKGKLAVSLARSELDLRPRALRAADPAQASAYGQARAGLRLDWLLAAALALALALEWLIWSGVPRILRIKETALE